MRSAPPTPKTDAQKAVFTPSRSSGTDSVIFVASKLSNAKAMPEKHPKIPRVVRISGPCCTANRSYLNTKKKSVAAPITTIKKTVMGSFVISLKPLAIAESGVSNKHKKAGLRASIRLLLNAIFEDVQLSLINHESINKVAQICEELV